MVLQQCCKNNNNKNKTLSSCVGAAGMKDIPPSAVTRPICGIMGTMRLVAGQEPPFFKFYD